MKNFLSKVGDALKIGWSRTWTYARAHKIIAVVIVLAVLGVGYFAYTKIAAGKGAAEYVLAAAIQAPLQVTVTGSGQVSAQDNLNLTPQASGQIKEITVKPGQHVKAGTIVAELDMTTAAQAVTSARQDLESAEISYQQAESSSNTSVSSDQTSVQTAQTTAVTALGTTYSNLATVMNGLNSNLYNLSTMSNYTAFKNIDAYEQFVNTPTSRQYHDQVIADYTAAQNQYQKTQAEFAAANATSLTVEQTKSLDQDTLITLNDVNATLKDLISYYNYINQQVQQGDMTNPSGLSSQLSNATGYQSTVNSDISSVTSANTSLTNSEQTLQNDTQTLGSTGSVPLSVQTAQLNVAKAQESLAQAETNESNYIVKAPFDGTIATVPANVYDQASSGTTIATLITTEEYVDLSLNETDVAKVQVGQPAVMTFDALPNITMDGTVAEVDPVGTVSQGVVTYDVKIGFNQQNSAIKPGMTTDATIITNSIANAIQVPSSAVQTLGNMSFVQVAKLTTASSTSSGMASSTHARGNYTGFARMNSGTGSSTASTSIALTTAMTTRQITVPASEATVTRVPVVTGISNSTMTQIVSGITPGEYVVTATQTASSKNTKSSAASATSIFGGSRTTGATGGNATFRAGAATGGSFGGAGRGG